MPASCRLPAAWLTARLLPGFYAAKAEDWSAEYITAWRIA